MIGRRYFLKGIGGMACWCMSMQPLPAMCREVKDITGCLLRAGDYDVLGVNTRDFSAISQASLSNSTGDKQLDSALGQALSRMARSFGVNPSFAFFQDGSSPNAYASSESVLDGTFGSVAFGQALFTDQIGRYRDSGVSVLAICAHEFGHICQYSRDLISTLQGGDPTVRRIELHADFLAGWYLGYRKRSDPSISLWASGDTFRRIGDTNFNNPDHHGTPEERVEASQRGFDLGNGGESSIDVAVQEGIDYISALP